MIILQIDSKLHNYNLKFESHHGSAVWVAKFGASVIFFPPDFILGLKKLSH